MPPLRIRYVILNVLATSHVMDCIFSRLEGRRVHSITTSTSLEIAGATASQIEILQDSVVRVHTMVEIVCIPFAPNTREQFNAFMKHFFVNPTPPKNVAMIVLDRHFSPFIRALCHAYCNALLEERFHVLISEFDSTQTPCTFYQMTERVGRCKNENVSSSATEFLLIHRKRGSLESLLRHLHVKCFENSSGCYDGSGPSGLETTSSKSNRSSILDRRGQNLDDPIIRVREWNESILDSRCVVIATPLHSQDRGFSGHSPTESSSPAVEKVHSLTAPHDDEASTLHLSQTEKRRTKHGGFVSKKCAHSVYWLSGTCILSYFMWRLFFVGRKK